MINFNLFAKSVFLFLTGKNICSDELHFLVLPAHTFTAKIQRATWSTAIPALFNLQNGSSASPNSTILTFSGQGSIVIYPDRFHIADLIQ